MTNIHSAIAILKGRIEELLQERWKLKSENDRLKKQIIYLNNKIESIAKERDGINSKYTSLKLGKTLASSNGDNHEARIKINRLVREIDKCIALLNKN